MTGKLKWVEGGLRGHRVHMLIGAACLALSLVVGVVVAQNQKLADLLSEANRSDYEFKNRSIVVTLRYKREPDSRYVNVRNELETFGMLVELFDISTPRTEDPVLNTFLLENIKAGLGPINYRNTFFRYLHDSLSSPSSPPLDSASVTRRGSVRVDTTVLRSAADKLLQVSGWPEKDDVHIDFEILYTPRVVVEVALDCRRKFRFLISVSKGFLGLLSSEDEAAAVLGHEFGHIDAYLKAIRQFFAGSVQLPNDCGILNSAQEWLELESSIDRFAFGLMERSGYDIRAAVTIAEKTDSVPGSVWEINDAIFRCRLIKLKKFLGMPTDEVCAPYLRLPVW